MGPKAGGKGGSLVSTLLMEVAKTEEPHEVCAALSYSKSKDAASTVQRNYPPPPPKVKTQNINAPLIHPWKTYLTMYFWLN